MSVVSMSSHFKNCQVQYIDNSAPDNNYIVFFVSSGFFTYYYGLTKNRDLKAVLNRYKNRYETGHEQKINALFNLPHAQPRIFYLCEAETKEKAQAIVNDYAKDDIWAINYKELTEEATKPKQEQKTRRTSKKLTPKK